MRKLSEFIESGQAVSMSQAKRLRAQGATPRVPKGAFRGAVEVKLDGHQMIQKSSPFTGQTWHPHEGSALAVRWAVQTATNLKRSGIKVGRTWVEEFDGTSWRVVEE